MWRGVECISGVALKSGIFEFIVGFRHNGRISVFDVNVMYVKHGHFRSTTNGAVLCHLSNAFKSRGDELGHMGE